LHIIANLRLMREIRRIERDPSTFCDRPLFAFTEEIDAMYPASSRIVFRRIDRRTRTVLEEAPLMASACGTNLFGSAEMEWCSEPFTRAPPALALVPVQRLRASAESA